MIRRFHTESLMAVGAPGSFPVTFIHIPGHNEAYNCKESTSIEKLFDRKHRAPKRALVNDINL